MSVSITTTPDCVVAALPIYLARDENRRTASAVTATEVELLCLRYDDLLQLAAQDAEFSFYLMRLMMRRMQNNLSLVSARGK